MDRGTKLCRVVLCAVAILAGSARLRAQKSAVPSRVVESVDDSRTVKLKGNVHPLARAANDQGALPDSQPLSRILLLLQRSPEQELSLRQLMDAQQTKNSPNYHSWLTPDQFGKQFGPSDSDIQTVTEWLTRQGFRVANVSKGRTVIEFSGNVGQVRHAFQTEIHKFTVHGEEHFANVSDPSIPQALSPVVAGIVALHNFPKQAQSRKVGTFQRDRATGQIKPLFTYTDTSGTFYGVGPADFAKIYNIPTTFDGTGQSIAVVGQSNINIQDVRDFRTMFGLPANDPQIIVNGPDPGLVAGDELEADLDVEWAGAVAPMAKIIFVTSQTTQASFNYVIGGVDLSALYIVDNNVAPVMSVSYGLCEPFILTAGNAFYNSLWQQASAEGITVVVAAGDAGSAGCDNSALSLSATNGLAVSGTASTPYNVAVGGTEFDQFTNVTNYWSATSDPATGLSALGYIAEIPWDDSQCAANFPTACTSVDQTGGDLTAGGGGASNCVDASSDTSGNITCSNNTFPNFGYMKPAFQTGLTPADSVRDIPDISLFASDGFNFSFYIVCQSDANLDNAPCDLTTSPTSGTINFTGVGGTSGGTPAFAGIMALVNQKTGQRQGNANYVLYLLAHNQSYSLCNSSTFTNPATPAPASCAFYDITTGNNSVACAGGSPNCSAGSSGTFGVVVSGVAADKGNPAYQAVTGYDLATGLGSINVANLLNLWSTASRAATTTTLGTPSKTSLTSGQSFSVPITVTGGGTGSVSLSALASDQTTILASFGPFTLSGTSATATTNLLPPTTAYVQGYYGGDVAHASSISAPVAVAVAGANQASKTTLNFVTFDANNNPVPSTSSQTLAYGTPYILQVLVTNSSNATCLNGGTGTTPGSPCPKGTVALTDNGSALNDWPIAGQLNATNIAKLNNQGNAEDVPIQLNTGTHSISAAFTTADTNFKNSTSNTLSVKITQATTTIAVFSSVSSITAGTNVTLTAYVVTNSNGAGPTGTMSFTNGSSSIGTANCVPTNAIDNTNPPLQGMNAGTAYCTATLATAISSLYPPPGTGRRTPGTPVIPILVALLSLILFGLGLRWIPQSGRRAYAYAGLLGIALLTGVIAGCGGGSSGGGGGGGGNRTITASYPGDTNYGSGSGTVSITVQ
jgi:Pro-kumamolisin, activation domain